MREIREKIADLTATYGQQLDLYEQIREVGSKEQELITKGHLDLLLQVLKQKEALLKQASGYETQIRVIQDLLIRHFKLTSFSVPQLKIVASVHYQEQLASLEAIITRLVPVLEILEEQERRNEASLNKYLEKSQGSTDTGQVRRATRAYGKLKP